MTSARANARRSLALWHRIAKSRDQRILDAYDAGLTKSEIHRLTGVSRPHIDVVIRREQDRQCHPSNQQPETAA